MIDDKVLNNDDFVLASFPRSGNTWLRFIFANLMSRNEVEITFHNYHRYIPDIHVIEDFADWCAYPPFPRIIKSHLLPQPDYNNAIYIVRDPRAAIVSHWHHKGKPGKLEEFVCTNVVWPAVWHEHVEQWLEFSYTNNVLIIKYEDMLSHKEEQIQSVLNHLGIKGIGQDNVLQAIDRSSFEQMSEIEKEQGFWRPLLGDKFVRSGKSDSWKEDMSPSILDAVVERNYKMMKYFNYI